MPRHRTDALPPQVYVAGPDAEASATTFLTVDVPKTAQPIDGACQSNLTVTAPYAPRYTIGVSREGQGIGDPDDPAPEWVTTRGDSQDVRVVSHVVQTVS